MIASTTTPIVSAPVRAEPTSAAEVGEPELTLGTKIRGAGVAVGPALLLDVFVAASTGAVAAGFLKRPRAGLARLLKPLTAVGAALPWAYLLAVRPRLRRWGATDDEVQMALPGDELVPNPGYQHTRAITINAPAAAVWPWLTQIGPGRGGFYSYE